MVENKVPILSLLLLLVSAVLCAADTTVKIHSTITEDGRQKSSLQKIYYRHEAMRRKESRSDKSDRRTTSFAEIANCDTKTGFLVDLDAREYVSYNVVKFPSIAQLDEYLKKNPGSAVQVESHTIDTGERRVFFGHPARHLITTIKRPTDARGGGGEDTVDGWYVDHERPDNHCAPELSRDNLLYLLGTVLVTYPEVPRFKHIGPIPDGLAIKQIRTVKFIGSKDGVVGRVVTGEETVEDLSDAPISPSLFEIPSGFHKNPQLLHGQPTPSH